MLKLLSTLLVMFALIGLGQAQVDKLKSRAIDNFFCNDLINYQIYMEFNASQTYLSLANYFSHDAIALNGFAKKFEEDAKEEREHGLKLMNYVTKRGGRVCTPSTDSPTRDATWNTLSVCKILEMAIEMEKAVSAHLLKIHQCARGEKVEADEFKCKNQATCAMLCETKGENKYGEDPQLQDFLEGEYLNEQVEGIKHLADMLTRLERATKQTNCDGLGLYLFDKEL